ncbi:MAG: ankyrin repeat domain-containing protein [Proteobacteria bacterium]|nr:ankyrin repeat domain-containing protein [Pseudomonadota bacterium]
MAKTYDKTYEESGTFSPRVAKRFLDIDFIVEYSAAQRGALNLVKVKRYMLPSPDITEIDRQREKCVNSITPLELNSLKKALQDEPENTVFLWDTIVRAKKEIHTLCVVKINTNLYLIDPSSNDFSSDFVEWINTNTSIFSRDVKHSKKTFYKSDQRDCIDIAFKIAQRIALNLSEIVSQPNFTLQQDKIKEIIQPVSNIKSINALIGAFDEISLRSLQSSDLELSNSALNYIQTLDEYDKTRKNPTPIDKKSYKNLEEYRTKLKAQDDKVLKLKEKLHHTERDYHSKLATYEEEQNLLLNQVIEEEIIYDENGFQYIHRTIHDNQLDLFAQSLSEKPNRISYLTANRDNTLHIACIYGRTNFIKFIKLKYPELFESLLNIYNDEGKLPIHSAYYAGEIDTINFLLSEKPDLMFSLTKNKATVMHVAAMYGHVKLLNAIIESKPEFLNQYDKSGWTPLHSAIYGGEKTVIEYLWSTHKECFRQKTKYGQDVIELAVKYDNLDIVEYLIRELDYDLNKLNKDGYALIHKAYIDSHNLAAIELLLKLGANPNIMDKRGDTLVHYAAEDNNGELLNILKTYKTNFNVEDFHGSTALDKSIHHLSNDVMQFLAQQLDPVLPLEMKILVTVCLQNIERLSELLKISGVLKILNKEIGHHGVIINKACALGNIELIKILHQSGSILNENSLEEACYADHELTMEQRTNLVSYLIGQNIPITSTAIHNTLYLNDTTILKIFLSKGANPDADNGIGFTPLLSILINQVLIITSMKL